MNRILVTGCQGQVGEELVRVLSPGNEVIACDRRSLDLTDLSSIRQVIRNASPNIIINAAAYTAVDKAENDEELAHRINAEAPGVLAEEVKRLGALFVHYSTDYVFDGSSNKGYAENDDTRPINMYGLTKLAGEEAVKAECGNYLIFRTSWVYGVRGKNFLLTMLKFGIEKDFMKVVDDQFGAPTWSRSIAQNTANAISLSGSGMKDQCTSGIYHMTSSGSTSWHGFAEEIFRHAALKFSYPSVRLIPIPSNEYPVPTQRPKFSALSNLKLEKTFNIKMPDWKTALHQCMEEVNWNSLLLRQTV